MFYKMVHNMPTEGSSRTMTPMDTLTKDEIGSYSNHVSMNRQTQFRIVIFFSIITLLLASALAVLLPSYLLHVNRVGDGYSLLFFVSFCSTAALLFLCTVRKIWDKNFHLWHGIVLKEVVKCGIVRSVSAMLVVYSFGENRVPCHLQEALVSLSVVYAVVAEIVQLFKGNSEKKKRSLYSCLFVCAGIFLILALPAANRYTCHGTTLMTDMSSENEWRWEQQTTWCLVCFIGVLLLSWNSMHIHHAFIDKPVEYYKKPHRLSAITLANVFSFLTIVTLFWTDSVKTIGKASSLVSFFENFHGGIHCHFSTAPHCGDTMLFGWLFIFCFILYNFSVNHIFFLTGSRSLPILLSGAGLAVSTFWWYLFQLTEEGILWYPNIDLSFCIWMLGYLMIIASFWVYYKNEFRQNRDSSQCSSILKTETEV